jgi:hypothetical protein
LGARVSEESEARKLLEEGMVESYVDFVYLTKGNMPVAVYPADYAEEQGRGYKVGLLK